MEMLPLNNLFLGLLGGVNASALLERASSQEGGAPDFFTMLKSIISAGCLKGEAAGAEGTAMVPELCIPPSSRPTLPALFQKSSIGSMQNGKGQDGGNFGGDLLEDLSKEQTTNEGDIGSLEIDLMGIGAHSMNALAKLIALLSGTLSGTGELSLSVEQTTANEPGENVVTTPDGQPSPCTLSCSDENKEAIAKIILPLLTFISEALSQVGISAGQTADNGDHEDIVTNADGEPSPGALSCSDENKEAIAKIILPLLTIISEALSGTGMSVGQAADNSSREDIVTNADGEPSPGALVGTDGRKLSSVPELDILTESVLAAQITNDAYMSTEQFVAKKEDKRESLQAPLLVERDATKRVVLTIGGRESGSDSLFQGSVRSDFGGQADNKIEVLFRNLADMTSRKEAGNNAATFSNHLLAGADSGDVNVNGNSARVLLNQEEKVLTETVVKLKEDTEPPFKDMKQSSHENEYLPFSKNPDDSALQEAQTHKVVKETAFSSVMTEKIEKILEQISAKGSTMDMVLRLKIDDRETLLVGLKNEGTKVMVDVKTSNEGVTNILQTQKDVISRNLEEKHVYTNIYVDPDADGSFERRESRRDDRKKEQDSSKTNFIEFLEARA